MKLRENVPSLDWTQAFKLACNENGLARFDAIAWSDKDKVLSFRHFNFRWTIIWLDYDRDDLDDIFVESNGIPGGISPQIIWEKK